MTNENLESFMIFNREGVKHIPLFVSEVNGSFIVAAYQGSLSKFDILIKYRQKIGDKWKIRQIHFSYPNRGFPSVRFSEDEALDFETKIKNGH